MEFGESPFSIFIGDSVCSRHDADGPDLAPPVVIRFYVVVDGHVFPHPCWDDFAIVVLSGWMQRLREAILTKQKETLLRFMEGPYSVRLSFANEGSVRFTELVNEVEQPGLSARGVLPLRCFVARIAQSAKQAGRVARQARSGAADLKLLRAEMRRWNRVAQLRRILEST